MSYSYGEKIEVIANDGEVMAGMTGVISSQSILGVVQITLNTAIGQKDGTVRTEYSILEKKLKSLVTPPSTGVQNESSDFEVGDEIEIIKDGGTGFAYAKQGMTGSIVFIRPNDDTFLIDFGPDFRIGHDGHGVLGAATKPSYRGCYNVDKNMMRLVGGLFKKSRWTREEIEHLWNCTVATAKGF